MKRITINILAIALLLGLGQCKKQEAPVTPVDDGKRVHISVNVNQGDKHIVYPGTGAYVFENGDKLYVGNNGHYVGTLTYSQGVFSGDIYDPQTTDFLHFYFTGGKEPVTAPTQGSTESFTVSIADQSDKLPVLSYAHSTKQYTTATATYSCILENKCGLVKFVPSVATSDPVAIGGMKTMATIDFATPGITPVESTGAITLYSESDAVKWAILLPQEAVDGAEVALSGYFGSCDVPEINANLYYSTGVGISLTKDRSFSVGINSKVFFAPGNLNATSTTTYQLSEWTWSFAPTQYSYIGKATANTALLFSNQVNAPGTVDLFGWVGESSSLPAYGISANTTMGDYGNTADEALKSDWGVPANAANLCGHNDWRTPTSAEWEYLFNTRANASDKYGQGSVDGVHGMIILPDIWDLPEGLNFTPGESWWKNEYTVAQWAQMEENGAVFLPASGYRYSDQVSNDNVAGVYLSSTSYESQVTMAYVMYFSAANIHPKNGNDRHIGGSVRLVRNAH